MLAGAQWEAPVLPESSRIVGYASDSTAIVEGPSGRSLLASLLPLRSPDGGPVKEPVSTDLERVAGGFEPANALSEVSIPADVGDGVGLDRVGITVTPVGVDGADGVRVADDKVFYANARTDTDLMVAALPTGVETFAQIRSARSPNNQSLRFALPAGASLRSGAGGVGAEVVRGGAVLARVSPAVAVDANGLNVPVSMGVSGDTVDLRVDDSVAGVEYPIMLDPTISVDSRFLDVPTSSQSFMGWEFRSSNPNAFTSSTSGAWGRGLYSLARASAMASGDVGQWTYTAPGDAKLQGFGFGSATRVPNPANGFVPICTSQGIRTAGGVWEPGSGWGTVLGSGSGPRTVCQGGAVTESAAFAVWPESPGSPGGGSASNVAVNLQWAYGAGTRLRYNNDPFGISEYDFIGSAYVVIADDKPPSVGVSHSTPVPDGWVRDFTGTVSVGGNDSGTGVSRLSLSGPVASSGVGSANQVQEVCSGVRSCPASWNSSQQWPASRSFTYSSGRLPEGVNTIAATATDRAGNVSGKEEWTVKVDRTPPNVTLGGSLSDGPDGDPTDPVPELFITADDPVVNGSASGVASAELFVDGAATNTQEQQDLQRIETDQCTDAECRFVGPVLDTTEPADGVGLEGGADPLIDLGSDGLASPADASPNPSATDTPSGDEVVVDATKLQPGPHRMKLVVTDKAGNRWQKEWTHTVNLSIGSGSAGSSSQGLVASAASAYSNYIAFTSCDSWVDIDCRVALRKWLTQKIGRFATKGRRAEALVAGAIGIACWAFAKPAGPVCAAVGAYLAAGILDDAQRAGRKGCLQLRFVKGRILTLSGFITTYSLWGSRVTQDRRCR